MFKNIKNVIQELAYSAVNVAEQSLVSKTGKEKKEVALEYVISMLPIMPTIKPFMVFVLSKIIDEAIEHAVKYMHDIKNTQEG